MEEKSAPTIVGLKESPFLSNSDSLQSLSIEQCFIGNLFGSAARGRSILLFGALNRGVTRAQVEEHISFIRGGEFPKKFEVKAVRFGRNDEAPRVFASDLKDMVLGAGYRETTIGKFLKDHEKEVLTALDAKYVVHEPYLEWMEGETEGDKAINPE